MIKWLHRNRGLSNGPASSYVKNSLMSSTQDHIWSQKKACLEQNISIGSFHASFHNFHNVSIVVKWPQKLVMFFNVCELNQTTRRIINSDWCHHLPLIKVCSHAVRYHSHYSRQRKCSICCMGSATTMEYYCYLRKKHDVVFLCAFLLSFLQMELHDWWKMM